MKAGVDNRNCTWDLPGVVNAFYGKPWRDAVYAPDPNANFSMSMIMNGT